LFAFDNIVVVRVVYGIVMWHHQAARKQFQFDVVRWSITIALMIVLLLANTFNYNSDILDFALFLSVVGVELSSWLISRTLFRQNFVFPVHLDMLQIRWGVWVMIVVSCGIYPLRG
jgi:hypothetical protein